MGLWRGSVYSAMSRSFWILRPASERKGQWAPTPLRYSFVGEDSPWNNVRSHIKFFLIFSRCRLPCLLAGASSKSIDSRPPQHRAARYHTSPIRKSAHTRRCGKLQSGRTSAPGHHKLRQVPTGSGISSSTKL